jgi:hypothetical protein
LRSEAQQSIVNGVPWAHKIKMAKRKQHIYSTRAYFGRSDLFFIFHCCCCCYSHLFTNDDGIPPRLYTASKKTDSMPASRFDYSWTEKERKKNVETECCRCWLFLCVYSFIAHIQIGAQSIQCKQGNMPLCVYIASSAESWSVVFKPVCTLWSCIPAGSFLHDVLSLSLSPFLLNPNIMPHCELCAFEKRKEKIVKRHYTEYVATAKNLNKGNFLHYLYEIKVIMPLFWLFSSEIKHLKNLSIYKKCII